MLVFFIWITLSILIGVAGSSRKIGFWGAFFLSALLSPLIGLIGLLLSSQISNEQYVQQVSPESIHDKLTELEKAKEDRLITEAEYQRLRNKILNQ